MLRKAVLAMYCTGLSFLSIAQSIKIGRPFPFRALPASLEKHVVRNRSVLIEAFSSHCVACFSTLPAIKSTQDKYRNKLSILLVGLKDDNIERTYQRFADHLNLSFPVAFDSTFFHGAGFQFLPTFIWIDKAGVVRGLTGPSAVNEDNINLFLSGKRIIDDRRTSDPPVKNTIPPLLQVKFARWSRGESVVSRFSISETLDSLVLAGTTLSDMYLLAYFGKTYISPRDSLYGNVYPVPLFEEDSIGSKTRYNYRLSMGEKTSAEKIRHLMQENLQWALPYSARIEMRAMPCWNLVVKGGDTLTVASKLPQTKPSVSHAEIIASEITAGNLIQLLHRYYPFAPPILDATGMKGPLNVRIEGILSDRTLLRKALQQNGLDLIESKRMMKVVVVIPKKGNVAAK